MKRSIFAVLLLLLLACAGCAQRGVSEPSAPAETVGQTEEADALYIADFVNGYGESVMQPGLTEEELRSMTAADIDCTAELEQVTFTVEEFMYDGCCAYLLVRAVPKDGAGTLLISTFGRDAGDQIPGATESFQQRAEREGKTLVYAGLSLPVGDPASGLSPTASFDDRYCDDGSMLLFAQYSFTEAFDMAREQRIEVKAYAEDAPEAAGEALVFSHAPTAQLDIQTTELNLDTGYGTINSLELRRSSIAMSATVSGTFYDAVTAEQVESFNSQSAILYGADGAELVCFEEYILAFGPDGGMMDTLRVGGGETFAFQLRLAAGDAMPESVSLTLHDYVRDADVVPEAADHSAPLSAEAEAAFRAALLGLLNDSVWPDGTDAPPAENRSFGVCDVDGDGEKELVVCLDSDVVAACTEMVYGFDGQTGSLREELCVFPSTTFFVQGLVKEQWSHNQGLAPTGFWPYTLYSYNGESDAYEAFASVDAWEKAAAAADADGNAYPDAVDAEGAGIVYLVTRDGVTETLSQSAYDAWYAQTVGAAEERVISYATLDSESIDSLANG